MRNWFIKILKKMYNIRFFKSTSPQFVQFSRRNRLQQKLLFSVHGGPRELEPCPSAAKNQHVFIYQHSPSYIVCSGYRTDNWQLALSRGGTICGSSIFKADASATDVDTENELLPVFQNFPIHVLSIWEAPLSACLPLYYVKERSRCS